MLPYFRARENIFKMSTQIRIQKKKKSVQNEK